jgi:AraC-like DNA-binding protein
MPAEHPRYIPDEILHASGVEVSTFDELYAQNFAPAILYGRHRASFYHIFRYTGEDNTHYVANRKITPGRNSLLIINRDVLHRYSRRKCSGTMVLFTDAFLCGTVEKTRFLNSYTLLRDSYAVVPIRSERHADLIDLYLSLIRKLQPGKKTDFRQATATVAQRQLLIASRNWLHNLLMTVEREYRQRSPGLLAQPDADDCMSKFKALLNGHFRMEKQVRFYAEQLGVSEKKLSQTVDSVHGISAKTYINERIMQEAVYLLEHTTLNQGEIALRLGFDFTYFVKFFRKHTGGTPARYRQGKRKGDAF